MDIERVVNTEGYRLEDLKAEDASRIKFAKMINDELLDRDIIDMMECYTDYCEIGNKVIDEMVQDIAEKAKLALLLEMDILIKEIQISMAESDE